jgi:methionine--tRNA ligase beta chain
MINFEDFEKIDLRVGKVLEASNVDGSEKLLKLQIDLGEEKRQIISGIAKFYKPEELVGKSVVMIVNLESRTILGLESQGMVLAVKDGVNLSVLVPEKEIIPGSKIT